MLVCLPGSDTHPSNLLLCLSVVFPFLFCSWTPLWKCLSQALIYSVPTHHSHCFCSSPSSSWFVILSTEGSFMCIRIQALTSQSFLKVAEHLGLLALGIPLTETHTEIHLLCGGKCVISLLALGISCKQLVLGNSRLSQTHPASWLSWLVLLFLKVLGESAFHCNTKSPTFGLFVSELFKSQGSSFLKTKRFCGDVYFTG